MAIKELFYRDKSFTISYEIINADKPVDIVFLHGWGSNKEIMKSAFGDKMKGFRHIYIDMPGFGRSSNEIVLDSVDYKKIINIFLSDAGIKKDIILGHSFGGKIATLLEPNLLVLLSSAGIVVEKPLGVKMKITLFKFLKSLGLGGMYRFFASKDAENLSQNMYETFKKVVDEDFRDIFRSYKGEALIFWGKDDTATPLSSGKEISRLIKNSQFYEFEGDHFFFLKHAKEISEEILKFPLKKVTQEIECI